MASLYDELGGFDALLSVCHRWHTLALADPVAAHPFEKEDLHPAHIERLAAYLAEATGGPALYTAGYGDESLLQRLHAGNGEHADLDERCTSLFEKAIRDVGVPDAPGARLATYFHQQTLAQRAYAGGESLVPDGLPLPHAE